MTSGPIQLAWEKVDKPESIWELHHALQEALCYHHALTDELRIPESRIHVCYDQTTTQVYLEVSHTLTLKTFVAKVPYSFHNLSTNEFMEELKYACSLWGAATQADRDKMFERSFVGKNLEHLQASLLAKGFDCRRTRPPAKLVLLS